MHPARQTAIKNGLREKYKYWKTMYIKIIISEIGISRHYFISVAEYHG